jgi:hypothetical protein
MEYLNTIKCDASELDVAPKALHDHINDSGTILWHSSSIAPCAVSVSISVFMLLTLPPKLRRRLCTELFSQLSGERCLTLNLCCQLTLALLRSSGERKKDMAMVARDEHVRPLTLVYSSRSLKNQVLRWGG